MRLSLWLGLALAAVCSAAPTAREPFPHAGRALTESTWTDVAKGTWLVEFYSPACSHCRALAPTWRELVDTMGDEAAAVDFHYAQVDCIVNGDLCGTHEIKGYPTLFLYVDGKFAEEYGAARDLATLTTFTRENFPLARLLRAEVASSTVVVPSGATEPQAVPSASVDEVKPAPAEVPARTEDDVSLDQPSFVKQVIPREVLSSGTGGVIVLEGDNALDVLQTPGAVGFVKYFAPWCHHCQMLAPKWKEAAGNLQGKVQLYSVDCDDARNKAVCRKEQIKGYPTLVFYNDGGRSEYRGPRDGVAIEKFALKAATSTEILPLANEYELKRAVAKAPILFLLLHPGPMEPLNESLLKAGVSEFLTGLGAPVHASHSPDLLELFSLDSPTLLVFKDGNLVPSCKFALDSATVSHAKRLKQLGEFLSVAKLPTLNELSASNFAEIMSTSPSTKVGSTPLVVLAVLSPKHLGEKFEAEKTSLEELAREFTTVTSGVVQRAVLWAWVDGDQWSSWTSSVYGIDASQASVGKESIVLVTDPKTSLYWTTGLLGEPLSTENDSIAVLIQDGILPGKADALSKSSKNLVERGLATMSRTSSRAASLFFGGLVSTVFSLAVLLLMAVLLVRWLLSPVGSRSPSSSYAKLE